MRQVLALYLFWSFSLQRSTMAAAAGGGSQYEYDARDAYIRPLATLGAAKLRARAKNTGDIDAVHDRARLAVS